MTQALRVSALLTFYKNKALHKNNRHKTYSNRIAKILLALSGMSIIKKFLKLIYFDNL